MPLKAVTELLAKHKIVEDMLRAQSSRRPELVETVVQNQHVAELRTLLSRMSPGEIGRALESVSQDDARLLWAQLASDRMNDVLWELPNDLGELLSGNVEPQFLTSEVTACELVDGRTRIVQVVSRSELESLNPIWIDVLGASKSERGWIGRHFGLDLPDPEDVTDLEVSTRFYVEEVGEVHLHSNFLLDREGRSSSVPVAFIVHDDTLFTVRSEELPVFRLQRLRMRSQPGEISDCKDLLLALYAADVEYSADALEDAYETLRRVGKKVLSESVSDADAARILASIAEEEDLNGRIRGNMLDTQRAVSFLVRAKLLNGQQMDDAREIVRDIESLNTHTAFLFEKINFLMDATVGFININQNRRVSQLTVAGVVFMPLNVLAGVGGMSEFSMMTQGIPWPISYGFFTGGMILVGWGTYTILKIFESRNARKRARG
ncbi:Magnesium and cobalt transport protein CorA [Paramagnetospirillum magnetotacticum MS-1]|uniref:Magnesium and cobalt transport protein CorA n=1 Tax=Paramagnetospirillum magnetotacticum MS-1 TaxID=272627 RepID=A0A0C2V2P0_PARME|nr:magnesium and cobalt transport protein CorA [Paramagnetospirillum magnetotacticum]KIL99351.1 Magnesium and cobalt transport protein CorA [Paramagnetospirillum magnetotacticum MS-1]